MVAFKEAQPEPARVEASASRTTVSPQRARAGSSFPSSGWKKLVAGRLLSATFTMQTMLSYFLDTIAGDGRSSSNFKAISATDNSAMRLFQRGFVQAIQVAASNNIVYYKARCEPEMKSTVPYQMKLGVEVVEGSGGDAKSVTQVVYAECSCPAGKAPHASCKHLAAFLYAMEEFSRLGYTRDRVTCTDELQAWNKPHKKKSEPMKLSEMIWSKSRGKTSKTKRQAGDHQDPRALSEREHVAARLRARLEDLESRRNGLFLVTSDPLHTARERQARIQHQQQMQEEWRAAHLDSAELSVDQDVHDDSAYELTPVPSECEWMDTERGDMQWYEEHVVVDKAKAEEVFQSTIHQSLSPQWYNERAKRITASMAKDIICRRPTTDPARLLARLTSTHLSLHTEAIDYGHAHEGDAVGTYSRLMSCLGVSQTVSPSGFVICVAEPWLGATPDGMVGSGIIEVKCPFVCRECSFEEAAATKRTFCLQKTQKGLSKHQYYHQVQVQLFVTKAEFCDFVVWSPSQLHIERIFPDSAYMQNIDKLRSFYFTHMLPYLVRAQQ